MLWLLIISLIGLSLLVLRWTLLSRARSNYADEHGNERDNNDYELSNKILFFALCIIIPICALNLYAYLGAPDTLWARSSSSQNVSTMNTVGVPEINTMVNGLRQRLEANPNDAEGWRMLGRSYTVLEQWDDAAKAYEQLAEIDNNSIFARLGLVDSLMMSNDPQHTQKIDQIIASVLEEEPQNTMARWLKAERFFEQQRFSEAIQLWNGIKKELPIEAPEQQSIDARIAAAQAASAGQ